MNYTLAWIVVGVAGLMGTVGLFVLTRSVTRRWLRSLLCLLPPALLLVPAPVPGFEGNYAPAFVVAIFESVFVAEGQPRPALVILVLALLAAVAAAVLISRFGKRDLTAEKISN